MAGFIKESHGPHPVLFSQVCLMGAENGLRVLHVPSCNTAVKTGHNDNGGILIK